jgi:UDP-glucose 4-epimerase
VSKVTVAVTGASGFLGRTVVEYLKQAGAEVVPVARRVVPGCHRVADYGETPPADVLVHLAEDSNRGRVNAAGTEYENAARVTLKKILAKPFHRVVYASSAALYGDESMEPHGIGDVVAVTDAYTRIKHHAEGLVAARKGVVVRLANLYGPGMNENNVVGTILRQIPGAGPLSVWDDKPIRDFLWIEDAAAAMAKMALGSLDGIYNLGSGISMSVHALAELALGLAGEKGRPIQTTKPIGRVSCLRLDISATTRDWGWNPLVDMRHGLEKIIKLGQKSS